METSLLFVIVTGIALLVVLAVAIGVGMDLDAQRQAWRRVAEERQHWHAERTASLQEPLCDRCPFRRLTDR